MCCSRRDIKIFLQCSTNLSKHVCVSKLSASMVCRLCWYHCLCSETTVGTTVCAFCAKLSLNFPVAFSFWMQEISKLSNAQEKKKGQVKDCFPGEISYFVTIQMSASHSLCSHSVVWSILWIFLYGQAVLAWTGCGLSLDKRKVWLSITSAYWCKDVVDGFGGVSCAI